MKARWIGAVKAAMSAQTSEGARGILPDAECIEWNGSRNKLGYGRLYAAKANTDAAHRYIWELVNGPIPKGMVVCHSCDNPPCVRIDHLFLGTQIDNIRDRHMKGRSASGDRSGFRMHPEAYPRGEQIHTSRLTVEKVLEIRRRFASGSVSKRALAREFGVSLQAICDITRRRTWTHI